MEYLKEFPGDTRVMRPGYEGGLNDVTVVSSGDVCLHVYDESYYGPHEYKSVLTDFDKERFNERGDMVVKGVVLR